MKRKKRTKKFLISSVIILCILLYIFPVYRLVNIAYATDFYSEDQIAKLLYIGSMSDRNEAEKVISLANKAFSDINHTVAENEEKYGLLACYATNDSHGDVAHTSYTLDLLSAHFDDNEGWIWVNYTSESIYHDGSIACGSYDIYSLWKLEKNNNGQWVVVDIYEHP